MDTFVRNYVMLTDGSRISSWLAVLNYRLSIACERFGKSTPLSMIAIDAARKEGEPAEYESLSSRRRRTCIWILSPEYRLRALSIASDLLMNRAVELSQNDLENLALTVGNRHTIKMVSHPNFVLNDIDLGQGEAAIPIQHLTQNASTNVKHLRHLSDLKSRADVHQFREMLLDRSDITHRLLHHYGYQVKWDGVEGYIFEVSRDGEPTDVPCMPDIEVSNTIIKAVIHLVESGDLQRNPFLGSEYVENDFSVDATQDDTSELSLASRPSH